MAQVVSRTYGLSLYRADGVTKRVLYNSDAKLQKPCLTNSQVQERETLFNPNRFLQRLRLYLKVIEMNFPSYHIWSIHQSRMNEGQMHLPPAKGWKRLQSSPKYCRVPGRGPGIYLIWP